METRHCLLIFGKSARLGELAAVLRLSPLLQVVVRKTSRAVRELHPDLILVDATQVTPEQFRVLIALCPSILSLDPDSYQLTVLSSPCQAHPLTEIARVVGLLSLVLPQPA